VGRDPFRTYEMVEVTVPCALFRCVPVISDGIRSRVVARKVIASIELQS
jgi:hypothetical protein